MQIIDGRNLATKIHAEVKEEIARLGITPGLAVILVGDNPASHLYVALKEKAAREVGIHFEKYVFAATGIHEHKAKPWATQGLALCGCQQCVLSKIQELNEREDIHGILVQVPLPPGYDEDVVINQIDPKKDVDGFHQVNLRAILADEPRIIPAVALGIVALVDEAAHTMQRSAALHVPLGGAQDPALQNKKITLIVNRTEFAAPIEYLLEQRGALVHIILRAKEITPDIVAQLRTADVLIVARGHAGIIKGNMLKNGAIVIDVGTNRLPDGRLVGDVDFHSTRDKTGFITPVPGGVGPMTVAMLLKNTLGLAKK